jgi:hypothetical protein
MANPWDDYLISDGQKPDPNDSSRTVWDTANFPFVVRWDIPYPDHRTKWTTRTRSFRTMPEAIAAYLEPFTGISVDCVMYNGRPPGQHLTRLAHRKATKPNHWNESVPLELRTRK